MPTSEKHFYKVDIVWNDVGGMLSWTVVACTCDRPWRHAWPA